jgi:predicted acyltransferase
MEWNYPPDLVFPAFLFIIGISLPLAINNKRPIRAKNILRVIFLFALGLALNFIRQFKF